MACRAQALFNQVFVVAANRTGQEDVLRFYGGSLEGDAWGRVLAEASDEETVLVASGPDRPGLDPASIRALKDRTGATIGFGLLVFLLLPIVAVLLFVTVVGIPLGLFLLLGLAFVFTIGQVVRMLASVGSGRVFASRFVAFLA